LITIVKNYGNSIRFNEIYLVNIQTSFTIRTVILLRSLVFW